MNRLALAVSAAFFCAATGGVALAASETAAVPAADTAQRMTRALNLLEAKGYGAFSNFAPDGKNFTATVTEGSRHFSVIVDPDSDQVTRRG
jgi:hypothetical protein